MKSTVKQPLSLGGIAEMQEKDFKEMVDTLISENVYWKSKDDQFPKLPKIFRTNKNGNIVINELPLIANKGKLTKKPNRMHTASVIYGYNNRVSKYFTRTNSDTMLKVVDELVAERLGQQMLENPEDYGLI